ncbi:MAG: reverse transcriptase family protein [Candidatus Thiodiazotropha taylori]|nr:reverse transcriptase family protein [Candidatus Thiodiazotropha taylori]
MQSTSPKQIDENISTFTKLMGKICDPLFSKHINLPRYDDVPKSKVSNQPWFDDECHEARKKFYFELNNYRKVKSEYNKSQLGLARSNFKSLTRKKRFNFEKEKTAKLIVSKNKNVKEYWKLLKQAANIRSVNPIGADKFSEYFQAINDPNDRFYQADEDILYFNERYVKGELQVMFDELNVPISIEEIKSSIKQLKNGASAGPDLLLNEFLKNGSNVMLNYLFNLFNKIFEIGYFPENWAEGFIIPVFKKGDKNDVSNYRGITLLSTVSKLFTRVLNNRLNDWAEQYNIYIEAQAGFRKCMGTVDNIFILNSLITHCLNHNERLYCAFIDFTKAFDFVVRDILWFKLLKIGVRGKILDIIKSMYKIVKSRVKHNNLLSQAFTCNLGVRQGECLSPFLFSMYLNDLQEELVSKGVPGVDVGRLNLYLLLYADDIVLFGKTPEDLQNALKILEDYCTRWKLTVNTKKTKIMVFRKGGRLQNNLNFYYKGSQIDIVNKFCYLGVVFTSGGSSFETQKTLAGQGLKAVFTLNKYLYKFTSIRPSHMLELFDKLVSPILNYASEVWGFYKATAVETVHVQFCKKVLGVKQSTQNDFVYGELGRTDYQSRRYLKIIKFWFKIISSEDSKYIKRIYKMMLDDAERYPQKQNWALSVKVLLSKMGFMEAWFNQGVGNTETFLSLFKVRIKDIFMQEWHARIETSTRARFYSTFASFKYQNYLDILSLEKFRKSISKLRLSSHKLEVEVGRWAKPIRIPLENRKCKICGSLEDEFHFVLECQLYTELRKQYIHKYYWKRPSMFKFTELCKSENKKTLIAFSVFTEKAFRLRKDNMPR